MGMLVIVPGIHVVGSGNALLTDLTSRERAELVGSNGIRESGGSSYIPRNDVRLITVELRASQSCCLNHSVQAEHTLIRENSLAKMASYLEEVSPHVDHLFGQPNVPI
jgi:hypothetical protein